MELPTILKPSQVLRLTKKGKLPNQINGGRVYCRKCGNWDGGQTESPTFWENGTYIGCNTCGKADGEEQTLVLALPVYPPCKEYPNGIQIDLTGERKVYPLTRPW